MLFAGIEILAQGSARIDSVRQAIRNRNRERAETSRTNDTIPAHYPVAKTLPQTVDDIKTHALDLKTPENITTDTIFNEKDSTYSFTTRLGNGILLGTPIMLTSGE